MIGQMSGIEESWEEATNNNEWLHADGEKEKKTRSWGQKALKKMETA